MSNFKSENWETVSPEEVPERDEKYPGLSIEVPAISLDGKPVIAYCNLSNNDWRVNYFEYMAVEKIRCWLRKKFNEKNKR